MPIQFPTLLQDSWNFIRNQPHFTLVGGGLLILVQQLLFYFSPKILLDPTGLNADTLDKQLGDLVLSLVPVLVVSVIGIFINLLLILNINTINNGQYRHFFQHSGIALSRLFPFIGLNLLMFLPLSIGSTSFVTGQAGGLSIIALPLMVTGLFLFVKWCLAAYVYLVEVPQKGVFETLSFTWQMSRGRMSTLFLFCLLTHLFPSVITASIANLGGIGSLLSQIVAAVFSLFVTVFGFRFYQAYRQY